MSNDAGSDVEQPESVDDDIWAGDKLGRRKDAEFLTKYMLGRHARRKEAGTENHFVMNVDAGWGFGKTFFLEKWSEDLKKQGHMVISYNAWENDFTDQPLLSFFSVLDEQIQQHIATKKLTSKFKTVRGNLKTGVKNVFKASPKILAEIGTTLAVRYGAKGMIEAFQSEEDAEHSAGEDKSLITEGDLKKFINQFADSALATHKATGTAIRSFRASLEALTKKFEDQELELPIFIFIDELDRCRPDFSIRLLEHIKHLFEVNDVYFIIATDQDQLSKAVAAVYGDKFDGEKYFNRFYTMTYPMKNGTVQSFVEVLIGQNGLERSERLFSIQNQWRQKPEPVSEIIAKCAVYFNVSLREVESVIELLELLHDSFPRLDDDDKIHAWWLVPLLFLKLCYPLVFEKILAGKNTISSILREMKEAGNIRTETWNTDKFTEEGKVKQVHPDKWIIFYGAGSRLTYESLIQTRHNNDMYSHLFKAMFEGKRAPQNYEALLGFAEYPQIVQELTSKFLEA